MKTCPPRCAIYSHFIIADTSKLGFFSGSLSCLCYFLVISESFCVSVFSKAHDEETGLKPDRVSADYQKTDQ